MRLFDDETSRCRESQQAWVARPIAERLRPVKAFRHLLVKHADRITDAVRADVGRSPDEVVGTDLLPTAAACQFLQRSAARVLAPRRVGWRPIWLLGCRDTVHYRPHGVVGVIGTWNYPVFLNAVPILQALAAGNGVVWKPREHSVATSAVLSDLVREAGFPPDLMVTLAATREGGWQLAEADVDFVHFTGSEAVGRRLAARLGERLVPSVLELSGCDAMFVLADADVELAVRAAWYGAILNAGQTCMAVKRAFVARTVYDRFVELLTPLVKAVMPVPLVLPSQTKRAEQLVHEAKLAGCTLLGSSAGEGPNVVLNVPPELSVGREAVFAPLLAVSTFDDLDDALRQHAKMPDALTSSVFTTDTHAAAELARRLRVGSVVVNDVIVPTAHPDTQFGGRRASGWGVTQGAEGLLAMTVPQVVTIRHGRFRPHVDALIGTNPRGGDLTRGLLRFSHGRGIAEKFGGLRQLLRGLARSRLS